MIRHYLQTLWWRMINNRVIVTGSLGSLVLGTVCIALLVTYLWQELSTDRFHDRSSDIYLTMIQASPTEKTGTLHIKRFMDFDPSRYPGVEKATTVLKYGKDRMVLESGDQRFTGLGLVVDSNFLEVFNFPMLLGKPTALNSPDAILLTHDFALKKFGNLEVVGKTIEWIGQRNKIYTVAGILADISTNSSIQFDFLVPHHSMYFQGSGGCFLLVNDHFDVRHFEKEITEMAQEQQYFPDPLVRLAAFKDLYFNRNNWDLDFVVSKHGNLKTLYIMAVIAVLVLIISILNLTNLWALQAMNDRKEILIRKVNGAGKMDLIRYQFGKTIPMLLITFIFSCLIYAYCLPAFNKLLNTSFPLQWEVVLPVIAGVLLGITLFAEIYPLMLISRPVLEDSISEQFVSSRSSLPRKFIISLQYTFTIVLLISAIVVTRQLKMMLEKDLGFNYTNVIKTKLIYEEPFEFLSVSNEERQAIWNQRKAQHQMVMHELESSPFIENFAQGVSPFEYWSFINFKPENAAFDYQPVNVIPLQPGYEEVFGFTLTAGQFFAEDTRIHADRKIIINEAARRLWNIQDIKASRILDKGRPGEALEIVGVIQDFNYEHLSTAPQALILYPQYDFEDYFFIRLHQDNRTEGLRSVETLFKKINPSQVFEYTFMEEEVSSLYQNEKRLAGTYIILTIVAFLLSGIGLFIVAMHEVEKRTKEIGIRKVNGAKTIQIITLLNRDFIIWVLLAFVIAIPIVYYSMSKWLENFAYRISLSWWIFILAGIVATAIALITVSWQSWRAATRNPVEVLKYE
ncbi:MAG: FtsX-like permease family protein [Saprospiraceae bacterium]|nr:ABC transporter permease [Lewinella sp.]